MRIVPPVRASHEADIMVPGVPGAVFPLMCPVREREWVNGWDPALVVSETGVVEPDCVFITRDNMGESTWAVTHHDPAQAVVEMVKITPGIMVTRLRVHCLPETGGRTRCRITYTYTALSPEGETWVRSRTAAWYRGFMDEWERELTHFLETRRPESQPE